MAGSTGNSATVTLVDSRVADVLALKQSIKRTSMSEVNSFKVERPDYPSRCTWTSNSDPKTSPHTKRPSIEPRKIRPDILDAIGNTPLIKVNKIAKDAGIKCEMLAKCEFFSPGGSVKDRIGYRMVIDAEEKGIIKPGYTIIEPTSGNTGIGLALASAVKGYRCIIVLPEKMSNEKVSVLEALGAEIVRTPTEAAFDSPESHIGVAQKLEKSIPNAVILNQYTNAGNPLAHYDTTALEIYNQCDGKVDMLVLGAGTGGTVTGIGRKFKELLPSCVVVAVDPVGSILAEPASLNKSAGNFYEVEGIGYDFIPTVLDRSVADKWIKSEDLESLKMARRLIREEGYLCGASSGAAMAAALKAAKDLRPDQRCVVLLPDSIRNYLTKMVSDNWMEVRGFKPIVNNHQHWWWSERVSTLNLEAPVVILPTVTCQRALAIMKKNGYDQLPVVDKDGKIVGMATMKHILNSLLSAKVQTNTPISKALFTQYRRVSRSTNLGLVSRILEKDSFALVVEKQAADSTEEKDTVVGIVTDVDLLNYITGDKASENLVSVPDSAIDNGNTAVN